jgi:hypothetical protein
MRSKVIISLIAILILLLSQYKMLFTGYANFFTIDNPTYGINAPIVVLSGGYATRNPKALELYEKGYGKRVLLTSERPLNSRVAHLFLTNEQKAEKIARALNVQVEFMKKWWDLSPKVASAALAHHGKGPVKGEPLTLKQVVGTANRIANIHAITHPVTTAFEDPPEEGYLDALQISQEDLDIVVDTTKIGLMAAETLLRSQ